MGKKAGGKKQTPASAVATVEDKEVPSTPDQKKLSPIPRKKVEKTAVSERLTQQSQRSVSPVSKELATIQPAYEDSLVDMDNKDTQANLLLIDLVAKINKVYPLFAPYKNLVEYLYCINQVDDPGQGQPMVTVSGMINSFSPFHIMALFYFKKTMCSQLF